MTKEIKAMLEFFATADSVTVTFGDRRGSVDPRVFKCLAETGGAHSVIWGVCTLCNHVLPGPDA